MYDLFKAAVCIGFVDEVSASLTKALVDRVDKTLDATRQALLS